MPAADRRANEEAGIKLIADGTIIVATSTRWPLRQRHPHRRADAQSGQRRRRQADMRIRRRARRPADRSAMGSASRTWRIAMPPSPSCPIARRSPNASTSPIDLAARAGRASPVLRASISTASNRRRRCSRIRGDTLLRKFCRRPLEGSAGAPFLPRPAATTHRTLTPTERAMPKLPKRLAEALLCGATTISRSTAIDAASASTIGDAISLGPRRRGLAVRRCPRRRAVPSNRKRARSARLRAVDGQAAAPSGARCSATCAARSRARNSSPSPAGAHMRRKITGFEALVHSPSSALRAGARARHLHPPPPETASSSRSANGTCAAPAGRLCVLAEAAARRRQSSPVGCFNLAICASWCTRSAGAAVALAPRA